MSPRLAAILWLKRYFWTPGKIQRLLDAAEAAGRNPLAMAQEVAARESLDSLRPAARRYVRDLRRARAALLEVPESGVPDGGAMAP